MSTAGASRAQQLFEHAVAEQRAGRKERAYALYQQVLLQASGHHDALFRLSGLDLEAGRWREAAGLLEQAVQLCPDNPAYYSNLGLAYRRLGATDHAGSALVRALQLNPEQVEASFQLGLLLLEQQAAPAAVNCLSRAAELRPDSFGIQQALARALCQAQCHEQAVPHFQCALALNPRSIEVCLELLAVLLHLGRFPGATALGRQALSLEPGRLVAHELLAFALLEQRRFDEAIAAIEHALETTPGSARLRDYLGHALRSTGRIDAAIAAYRGALQANPEDSRVHSSLLFTLAFHPDFTDREIENEARAWSEMHERPLRGEQRPLEVDRRLERRLRIGYVSPNFFDHCQSLFMLPLLRHHDPERVEVFCYSDLVRPDARTAEHRAHAHTWRDVLTLDDARLAQQIREDRIDILVDLTMHMPNHRLHVFARKPAPVQLSWLAYPGRTGLEAIDYRVSDPHLEPPSGAPDADGRLTLPRTFWCYDPLATEPQVNPLPAASSGTVTFGCLNDLSKVSATTLERWAAVFRALPHSRILLLAPRGSSRARVLEHFQRNGVAGERVLFTPRVDRSAYLALYRHVDIVLDCLPYNGHTTSLDAFWMGVPVVTQAGNTIVGRAGLSQAYNLGLTELVASTADEFVAIACTLARDLDRLAMLRGTLRERLRQSPLMDAPSFAHDLESAYRRAWRRFCEREN